MSLEDDIVKLKLPPPNYKKTPITLRSLMTPRQQIELDYYQTSKRIKEELEERKKRIKERESKRMKSDRERMNRENRESKDIGAIRANRSKE